MKMTIEQVNEGNYDYITISNFIDKYKLCISIQAVHYCIDNDLVDHIQPGREKLIVLTEKTLSYKPMKRIKK